ncbi:trafficking protein particle complex subunit 5-like [Tetranychus urticae]|uniref:trafficking protein particle complex subunit 5-like n=1 Tax=Tetranychus urticae TaxID=32264 RepID=UPI000D647FE4|nr:trafficking protein particle complex subunit 5-like [Tetranychus urticae]
MVSFVLEAYGFQLLLTFIREKNYKRETKLINILIFKTLWQTLFAKDADKLEHSNDDPITYYIIESDPIVNKYISYNRDEGSLNCASFIGGIIAAALNETGFNAKVTVHWHKGTTFMINFDQATIDRDKAEERILIKNLSAKSLIF